MPLQRCFLHQGDLFTQGQHVFVPITTAVEPWKRQLERRVLPAPCDPCGIVHDPQAAQCLDQVQLARIKWAKLLISSQQRMQLRCLLLSIAGQEHPQILYRRAMARIVEIDDVQAFAIDEHVAGMKIRVQPQLPRAACTREACVDCRKQVPCRAFVSLVQLEGNEAVLEQEVPGCDAEGLDVDCRPVLEGLRLAEQMHAGDESAELP